MLKPFMKLYPLGFYKFFNRVKNTLKVWQIMKEVFVLTLSEQSHILKSFFHVFLQFH